MINVLPSFNVIDHKVTEHGDYQVLFYIICIYLFC